MRHLRYLSYAAEPSRTPVDRNQISYANSAGAPHDALSKDNSGRARRLTSGRRCPKEEALAPLLRVVHPEPDLAPSQHPRPPRESSGTGLVVANIQAAGPKAGHNSDLRWDATSVLSR
jgi:hypothetical protein